MVPVRKVFKPDKPDYALALATPPLRHFWPIVLIITIGTLGSLVLSRMQAPGFEARAVMRTSPHVDVEFARSGLVTRANLLAVVQRHGLAGGRGPDQAMLRLRTSFALHPLISEAGRAFGLKPEVSGVVVSVLWSDPETAARIANDFAQQLLDSANDGHIEVHDSVPEYFRRKEVRLLQDIQALKIEIEAMRQGGGQTSAKDLIDRNRRLEVMQGEYGLVRRLLAETALDLRRNAAAHSERFVLLHRAVTSEAVSVTQSRTLSGFVASVIVAMVAALIMERRHQLMARGHWKERHSWRSGVLRLYRLFDDPAYPVLGMPRLLMTTGVVLAWLIAFSVMMR